MKRLISGLALMVVISLLVISCGMVEKKVYSDPSQIIDVGIDQGFIIALDSNPTTGYRWETQFKDNFLELVEKKYQTSEATEKGVVGAGGIETFEFKARAKGETEVTMIYKRSWEAEYSDMQIFKVRID